MFEMRFSCVILRMLLCRITRRDLCRIWGAGALGEFSVRVIPWLPGSLLTARIGIF